MPKFKTIYAHDTLKGFHFNKPSMVEPQFGYECDINNIVAGCVSTLNNIRPNLTYLDTTTVPDLETAMNVITKANSEFEKLPSDIRARFGNDPKQLLAFVHDEKNIEEAVKLGFLDKSKLPVTEDISVIAPVQGEVSASEPSA